MMNRPVVGWGLAVAAVVAGYWGYGVPGLALASTAIVFWLLLQFSRAMRVMRKAGSAPLGRVGSAVMLNAKLRPGMTMLEILPLTGSLGAVVGDTADETYRWRGQRERAPEARASADLATRARGRGGGRALAVVRPTHRSEKEKSKRRPQAPRSDGGDRVRGRSAGARSGR